MFLMCKNSLSSCIENSKIAVLTDVSIIQALLKSLKTPILSDYSGLQFLKRA